MHREPDPRPLRLKLTLAWLFLCAVAAGAQEMQAQNAHAHDAQVSPVSAGAVARKIDEYGKLGHCDMTARLDNLAVELMNEPGAKAYVVSYDPAVGRHAYAAGQLKVSRHYLVHLRGVDPERVVVVAAGSKGGAEGATELWLVPKGAVPPAQPLGPDKYTTEFSGKFDEYETNTGAFREGGEMGPSATDIAYAEFAEKLKAQPDSVGYLVIKTPVNEPPGAWRRVARRDEQLLSRQHGVEAGRLKSLDAGTTEGEYAHVELWIVSKLDPPPTVTPEKIERKWNAAFKLNTYNFYNETDADEEDWMLENLAEVLREHPRATALLVTREPAVYEPEPGETTEEPSDTAPPSPAEAQVTTPAPENGAERAGQEQKGQQQEGQQQEESVAETPEEETITMAELGEHWKQRLVADFQVDAARITVAAGRRMPWSQGRLNVWVVPERTPRPDPLARDDDETEEEPEDAPAEEPL
jgi:hypothetical protein